MPRFRAPEGPAHAPEVGDLLASTIDAPSAPAARREVLSSDPGTPELLGAGDAVDPATQTLQRWDSVTAAAV